MYFDYAATTPLHPNVAQAMIEALGVFGNPSSMHSEGRAARSTVDTCRSTIATYSGCTPDEVVFCGSGTEACNTVIYSACIQWKATHGTKPELIISPLEHKAVRNCVEALVKYDMCTVTECALLPSGQVDLRKLEESLTSATALVAIQWAHSETGLLQPVDEITALCKARTIPYLCDAMQAVPHLPLPSVLPDALVFAPHKFYGPKGIGILLLNKKIPLVPLVHGGGQEYGLRSGTENTVACAGTTVAVQALVAEQDERVVALANFKAQVISAIQTMDSWAITVENSLCIPGTLHLTHNRLSGEELVMKADLAGISISTGSACSIGASEPSASLLALGLDEAEAKRAIRISFGAFTTQSEVDSLESWLLKVAPS